MDWTRAIERNSEALAAVVAALFALLGTAEGAARISHQLHRAILRVLHPAEAAVRRLIVIAARGLAAEPHRPRPMPALPLRRSATGRVSFRLFDPRKRYSFEPRATGPRIFPRIHTFGADPRVAALWPAPQPPAPATPLSDDGLIDVRRIAGRLQALKSALADVPRQARRLVRLRARRERDPRWRYKSPLRPGPPPGNRQKPVFDIDFILKECHGLAFDALADTS